VVTPLTALASRTVYLRDWPPGIVSATTSGDPTGEAQSVTATAWTDLTGVTVTLDDSEMPSDEFNYVIDAICTVNASAQTELGKLRLVSVIGGATTELAGTLRNVPLSTLGGGEIAVTMHAKVNVTDNADVIIKAQGATADTGGTMNIGGAASIRAQAFRNGLNH
jgi:hypothetical protein